MLRFSIQRLAEASGIGDSSIRRIERAIGVPANVTVDMLYKLQTYLETQGFRFSWPDEGVSVCVSWHDYQVRQG